MVFHREIATQALGILGNIASCAFFLSSAPTIIAMIRRRSSGGLSGDLYVLKLLNCSLWVFYALPFVRPHAFWVLLTNSIGCAGGILYIIIYLCFGSRNERFRVLWKLAGITSSFAIMVVLIILLVHRRQKRIMIVGIFCGIISSGMHLTLLSQTREAIISNDAKYLHPNSSIAGFFKGAIWTAYGIVCMDLYIVIPNGVGVVIGCVQVPLAAILAYNLKVSKDQGVINKEEVDLEETNANGGTLVTTRDEGTGGLKEEESQESMRRQPSTRKSRDWEELKSSRRWSLSSWAPVVPLQDDGVLINDLPNHPTSQAFVTIDLDQVSNP